jgi:hypothetical protein
MFRSHASPVAASVVRRAGTAGARMMLVFGIYAMSFAISAGRISAQQPLATREETINFINDQKQRTFHVGAERQDNSGYQAETEYTNISIRVEGCRILVDRSQYWSRFDSRHVPIESGDTTRSKIEIDLATVDSLKLGTRDRVRYLAFEGATDNHEEATRPVEVIFHAREKSIPYTRAKGQAAMRSTMVAVVGFPLGTVPASERIGRFEEDNLYLALRHLRDLCGPSNVPPRFR